MSTFSAVLSALGLAPKTLPQANETLSQAKGTLDSVAALFTAAGLNLEQMLAAGPDSLKAHIDSLDNAEELATALQENETLSAEHEATKASALALSSQLSALNSVVATIGLSASADLKPDAIAKAFETHIAKATTLALAKTGHPPAHVPASAIDDITPPKNSEDAAAKAALLNYEALIAADNASRTQESAKAKADFYAKHHAQIDRGIQIRRRS